MPKKDEDYDVKITDFLSVFEEKLGKLNKRIAKHLEDKKNGGCDREQLKKTLAEAKLLKKRVKKMQEKNGVDNGNKKSVKCPHCKGEFDL